MSLVKVISGIKCDYKTSGMAETQNPNRIKCWQGALSTLIISTIAEGLQVLVLHETTYKLYDYARDLKKTSVFISFTKIVSHMLKRLKLLSFHPA